MSIVRRKNIYNARPSSSRNKGMNWRVPFTRTLLGIGLFGILVLVFVGIGFVKSNGTSIPSLRSSHFDAAVSSSTTGLASTIPVSNSQSTHATIDVNGQSVQLNGPVNYSHTFIAGGGASVKVSVDDHQSVTGTAVNQTRTSISVNANNQ